MRDITYERSGDKFILHAMEGPYSIDLTLPSRVKQEAEAIQCVLDFMQVDKIPADWIAKKSYSDDGSKAVPEKEWYPSKRDKKGRFIK